MHLNGNYSHDIKTITNNFKSSVASTYLSYTQTNLVTPLYPSAVTGDIVDLSTCYVSISEVFEELSLLKQ